MPSEADFLPNLSSLSLFYPRQQSRHQFFKLLSQHKCRDAPPWWTWLRTLHWWRKVGKDRKKKKNSPVPGRIRTHNVQITRRVLYRCATTVSQVNEASWLPIHHSLDSPSHPFQNTLTSLRGPHGSWHRTQDLSATPTRRSWQPRDHNNDPEPGVAARYCVLHQFSWAQM